MSAKPVVVVEIFDTSIDKVWDALTTKAAFDKWYFDINEFDLKVGFEFEFYGGSYLHHCKIVEFAPQSKLVYTWKYPVYEGNSVVTFLLEVIENEFVPQTKLTLTHEGIESFPPEDKNFSRESFEAGWSEIIRISLKSYLEGNVDDDLKVE
ncbi:SRPBCC domain-containing protein [Empedobacter falsenii]